MDYKNLTEFLIIKKLKKNLIGKNLSQILCQRLSITDLLGVSYVN